MTSAPSALDDLPDSGPLAAHAPKSDASASGAAAASAQPAVSSRKAGASLSLAASQSHWREARQWAPLAAPSAREKALALCLDDLPGDLARHWDPQALLFCSETLRLPASSAIRSKAAQAFCGQTLASEPALAALSQGPLRLNLKDKKGLPLAQAALGDASWTVALELLRQGFSCEPAELYRRMDAVCADGQFDLLRAMADKAPMGPWQLASCAPIALRRGRMDMARWLLAQEKGKNFAWMGAAISREGLRDRVLAGLRGADAPSLDAAWETLAEAWGGFSECGPAALQLAVGRLAVADRDDPRDPIRASVFARLEWLAERGAFEQDFGSQALANALLFCPEAADWIIEKNREKIDLAPALRAVASTGEGNWENMLWLRDRGADFSDETLLAFSASVAAVHPKARAFEELLKAGQSPRALLWAAAAAARSRRAGCLEALAATGLDPATPWEAPADFALSDPLLEAATSYFAAPLITSRLLGMGFDPLGANRDGEPLREALSRSKWECSTLILRSGGFAPSLEKPLAQALAEHGEQAGQEFKDAASEALAAVERDALARLVKKSAAAARRAASAEPKPAPGAFAAGAPTRASRRL